MTFTRTDEYFAKIFGRTFGADTMHERLWHEDAEIVIQYDGDKNKNRAWCETTNTWTQFPNRLRDVVQEHFICDVVESHPNCKGTKFMMSVKGSIRRKGSDEVVG